MTTATSQDTSSTETAEAAPSLLRRVARWSFTHRRIVLGVWVAGLVALAFLHSATGSNFNDSFKLSGTGSSDAQSLLQRAAPKASGDSDRIVVATNAGSIANRATRSRLQAMFTHVSELAHVGAVVSPFATGNQAQISKGDKIAYATVTFDEQANQLPKAAIKRVVSVAQAAAGHGLQVQLGGQAIEAVNPGGVGGAGFGFLAAAVVLYIVFGSLLGTLMPLLTAGIALGVGTAVIGILSNVINMASFSSTLSLLIGLGVGVDYALFIVTRFRQALLRGVVPVDAAVEAIDTSGRAVLFAGITVCIAMLGMFALGISFLYGIAIATSIVVAFTVLSAMTLLPALLGFFGPRILGRRTRRALAQKGSLTVSDESPAWARWAGWLDRYPALFAAAAAALLLVIAIPFVSIRLGSTDQGSDPANTTTRQAYDLLATGFGPGFNGPLQLVAAVPTAADQTAFDHLLTAAQSTPDVAAVSHAHIIPAHRNVPPVATAQVTPKGSPQAASTTTLLDQLRNHTIPNATRRSGTHVFVGGQTAIFADFSAIISGKLPLFIGVVVALSFLLLTAVFRSLVIPAMASVMNLLSAGAAFGVITAIFQWGWGASVIGIDRTGPIEAFLPVIVFAILFGLSMDYEVFLISRIYEQWHRRRDNREAIIHGLAATGRTINAAAAIMILVFAAFVLGGEHTIKLFGVGLAGAVLLDALIVRSILVPALMLLTGKANWWLPGRLERHIPKLNVEGSATASVAVSPAVPPAASTSPTQP